MYLYLKLYAKYICVLRECAQLWRSSIDHICACVYVCYVCCVQVHKFPSANRAPTTLTPKWHHCAYDSHTTGGFGVRSHSTHTHTFSFRGRCLCIWYMSAERWHTFHRACIHEPRQCRKVCGRNVCVCVCKQIPDGRRWAKFWFAAAWNVVDDWRQPATMFHFGDGLCSYSHPPRTFANLFKHNGT